MLSVFLFSLSQDQYMSMKKEGVTPNKETFHSMLRFMAPAGDRDEPKYAKHVPTVLAEMTSLGFSMYTFVFRIILIIYLSVFLLKKTGIITFLIE